MLRPPSILAIDFIGIKAQYSMAKVEKKETPFVNPNPTEN